MTVRCSVFAPLGVRCSAMMKGGRSEQMLRRYETTTTTMSTMDIWKVEELGYSPSNADERPQ